MKRDFRPRSAGKLSGGDAMRSRKFEGRMATTRSAPHFKKVLPPPKFLSSGENPLTSSSHRFGSTKGLDLSSDPMLEALLTGEGLLEIGSNSGGEELVVATPSRELSVTFEAANVEGPQTDAKSQASPQKHASYARTVKSLGLFEPDIPRKRITEFMLGWGARERWDRSATDSVMRHWNAQQIHQRKSFDSSTIAAEVTIRAAVKHAEAAGQKTPNSFTTAVALGQLAVYLDTLSDHFAPFAATLTTELLKAVYVNGNTTFEKMQERGTKSGISTVCKSMDAARLYKRITYHDAAKQLLARVESLETEIQMYSEGVTLQTLIEKRDLAIRYGSRKGIRVISVMLFYAWRGYIERKREKEFLKGHIQKIEEERHNTSEELKAVKNSVAGADKVRKEAQEAFESQKRHNAELERDMAKMEADDVLERHEMSQLRDSLRSTTIANETLQKESADARAEIQKLQGDSTLAAQQLAQVKADSEAALAAANALALEEQERLNEELTALRAELNALKTDGSVTGNEDESSAAAAGVAPRGSKRKPRSSSKEKA